MKFTSQIIVSLIIGICIVACITSISAQTTKPPPACAPDPLDSGKTVLEITGDQFLTTSFVITSAIDNCHIYIHDLVVSSIKITSPIINNSNITIRNVTSFDKSIATFIWFTETITDFSFINISNVSHSSLAINSATGSEWISIVQFGQPLTGKSDMTSWINIESLEMNDVVCDRTSTSSTVCSAAMVYFQDTISTVNSVRAANLEMQNISTNSSSSLVALSFVSAVQFYRALTSVQKITMVNFAFRNIHVRNNAGPCQSRLLSFASTISAAAAPELQNNNNINTPEFVVRHFAVENATSISLGAAEWRLLSVDGKASGYKSIHFFNISCVSVSSTSLSTTSALSVIRFASPITAQAAGELSPSSQPTSLRIEQVRSRDAESTANTSSHAALLHVATTVEFYNTLFMSDIVVSSWSSTSLNSTTEGASLYFLVIGSSITAPPAATTATPSSLVLENIRLSNAAVTAIWNSPLFVFSVGGAVTNFSTVRFTNVSAESLHLASAIGGASLYFLEFSSTITAPAVSSMDPSRLIVENARLESVLVDVKATAQLWGGLIVLGAVANYDVIQITNVTAESLHSVSASGTSSLYLLVFASSTSAFSSSSTAWMQIDNIRLENSSSTSAADSNMWFIHVGDLNNYNTIQIINLVAIAVTSTSFSQDSQFYLLDFGLTIAAPAAAAATSSSMLLIGNIRLENSSSTGYTSSKLYLFSSGLLVVLGITNYKSIQLTNITGRSLIATSSSGSANLYLVRVQWPITASSPSSSLIVDNIRMDRASCFGVTASVLYVVFFSKTISNYPVIKFTNVSGVNLWANFSLMSSIYVLYFGSSVSATSSVSISTASSLMLVDNIRLENSSSFAKSLSRQCVFYVGGVITNYYITSVTDVSASNALSSSSSTSVTYAAYIRGLFHCSLLQIQFVEMTNISTVASSSDSASSISLLTFASSTNFKNVSKISLQHSRLEQVTVSSETQSDVQLVDAGSGFQAKLIIVNNNSLLLLLSANNETKLPSTSGEIFVAILRVSLLSPGFLKLELMNNIFGTFDQYWQNICTPANCSIVRINDIQLGSNNNNNNQSSTLYITGSEITPRASSFIAFARYYGMNFSNANSPLLNVVLENNDANFTDTASVSSILGFESPPGAASPLPPLVFIDVKCNQWPRIVDRTHQQQLLSIASISSQVPNFMDWTCQTPSLSESADRSSSATLLASNSRTLISSPSSSVSIMRTSISPLFSETKTSDITTSKSLTQNKTSSKTADSSMSTSSSFSPSPIVPPPPYRSPLRVVYQTAASITSCLSAATISPSASLGAARSRSAIRHFDAILYGKCVMDEESLASQENDEAPDVSSSPTRMKLSDGGYLTGLVVGNICLIVGVGVLWFGGFLLTKHSEKEVEQDGKSNQEEKTKKNKKLKQKKTNKEEKNKKLETALLEKFAASNAHQMMFLFTVLFLEPSLTSSATSFLGGFLVEGRSISLVSIGCLILAWFLLLTVGLIGPMWKLVYMRRSKYDEFEETKHDEEINSKKFMLRRFVEWMTDPSGEWIFVGEKEKYKIEFELAVPFIEPFTPKFPKYIVVDVLIIVCLSCAEIAGYIARSCLARGIIVCIALSAHVLSAAYYTPLYTDRMSNSLAVAVEILSVAMIAGALSLNNNDNNNDDVAQIEVWSRVAVSQSMLQSVVMVLELAAVFLPIWDKIVAKMMPMLDACCSKRKEPERDREASTINLPELMPEVGGKHQRKKFRFNNNSDHDMELPRDGAAISHKKKLPSKTQEPKRKRETNKPALSKEMLLAHTQQEIDI